MSINKMEALLRDLDSSLNNLTVNELHGMLLYTVSASNPTETDQLPLQMSQLHPKLSKLLPTCLVTFSTVHDCHETDSPHFTADSSALSGHLHFMTSEQLWEHRFFVLSSEGLYMFASSSATEECQDKFILTRSTVLTTNVQTVASTPLAFELRVEHRVWILCASSKTSKNAWIDMIQVLITKPTLSSSASIDSFQTSSTELYRNDSTGDLRGYPISLRNPMGGEYVDTRYVNDASAQAMMLQTHQQRQYMQAGQRSSPRSPTVPALVSRINSVSTSYSSSRDSTATSDSWYFQGSSPQSDFYNPASPYGSISGSSIYTHVRKPSMGESMNAGIPGGGIFGGADLDRSDSKASATTAAWGVPSTKAVVDGLTLTAISTKTESIKSDEKAPKKKSKKAQVALAFCNF
ncbi:hypothetical protein BJ741DRAFT_604475 [Chytriomyces cf. hyalinus JEL632]|nr:hypothetical protein BJ741DRAFT_604475 [Chytriomyces cf. hyalinus JEL632]